MALLAMDLVGGGSVDNLVADFGPLPPLLAAELLSQLLGALDKIHTAGFCTATSSPRTCCSRQRVPRGRCFG